VVMQTPKTVSRPGARWVWESKGRSGGGGGHCHPVPTLLRNSPEKKPPSGNLKPEWKPPQFKLACFDFLTISGKTPTNCRVLTFAQSL